MQRVKSEEEGHQGAAPQGAGQPVEDGEQKQGTQHVKQEIRQMMPAALEAKELGYRHVREPGERNPVAVSSDVKAHATPEEVSPARTWAFSTT